MAAIQKRRQTAGGKTTYRVVWRGPDGRQHSQSFDRRRDADIFGSMMEADKARGLYIDPKAGAIPFSEYAARWVSVQTWRESTLVQAESHLNARILPAVGHLELRQIRHSDIQTFVSGMHKGGLSPRSTEVIYRRLSAILEAAVRDRMIQTNPAYGVRLPRQEKTARESAVALSSEQLESFVDALPDRLRALAWTMALAGLRPSEATGLTVDRVDFLRQKITVDRQLVSIRGRVKGFGPPKTASSNRVVPVADELLTFLSQHLAAYGEGPNRLLFRSAVDTPLTRGNMQRAWVVAVKGAAVPPPENARGWHSLRHTFVSANLAADTPLVVVSRMVGHKSISETAQVYSHMLPGADEAARGAAASILLAPMLGNLRQA
jgi:integrase